MLRRSLGSRRLATRFLLWYARHVPYHRGKTRLSRHLREIFGVELAGEIVERRDGLWWSLDRGDYMSQDLYWSGANDRAELRHALRLLPRGGVMLDVGANFGSYCITIAARLHEQCTIHAFEPHPIVFERLRKNIALNGAAAVTPYQEGLSDREDTAGIVEMRGHSGATYLRPGRDVAVTTLDRFCERASIARLDLIKIDAEGAELRILRGGATTLARFRPALLLELNAPTLEREAATLADVLALLRSSDYRVYSINPHREIIPGAARFPGAVFNVLCLPRERFGAVPLTAPRVESIQHNAASSGDQLLPPSALSPSRQQDFRRRTMNKTRAATVLGGLTMVGLLMLSSLVGANDEKSYFQGLKGALERGCVQYATLIPNDLEKDFFQAACSFFVSTLRELAPGDGEPEVREALSDALEKETAGFPFLSNRSSCDECVQIIHAFEDYLNTNRTARSIAIADALALGCRKKFINKTAELTECLLNLEAAGVPQLVDYYLANYPPVTACQEAQFCPQ